MSFSVVDDRPAGDGSARSRSVIKRVPPVSSVAD